VLHLCFIGRLEVAKAQDMLKEKSLTTDEPADAIVAEVLQGISMESRLGLTDKKNLKRAVQQRRRRLKQLKLKNGPKTR